MSRESIQRSIVEIVAASGIGGLSVRAVAARSGVAIGTVQHHFPSRSAMISAAMSVVEETAGALEADLPEAPADRLESLVSLLVPGSPESTATRVWLAFAAQAAVDADVAAQYRQVWGRVHRGLAELFAQARPERSWATAEDCASEILALADGLAVSVLIEPARVPADSARERARRRLHELLA